MLINYEFGNFRSFKAASTLSMTATKQRTLNENLIRTKELRLLPSAVIYGANASGKSNVIKSMDVLCSIISTGNLSANVLQALGICPFLHDDEENPIHYCIDFINNETRFKYTLDVYAKKISSIGCIVNEELAIVDKNKQPIVLYKRSPNKVSISKTERALDLLKTDKKFITNIERKLNDNLDNKSLFLTGGFKNIISSQIADIVIDFFSEKFLIVNNFDFGRLTLEFKNMPQSNSVKIWNEILDMFVKAADFGPQQLSYVVRKNDNTQDSAAMLISEYAVSGKKKTLPAKLMESDGTIKLIGFTLLLHKFFTSSGVMVIDEFDSSLHPEIVKGLIALFNDITVNASGAQLIFTTHNPIYLNNEIFRRDQIFFVEKDKSSYQSTLYTLADFGSEEVRNDENYLINYFKGKYCSMPFIDFSLLLKNAAIEGGKNEKQ